MLSGETRGVRVEHGRKMMRGSVGREWISERTVRGGSIRRHVMRAQAISCGLIWVEVSAAETALGRHLRGYMGWQSTHVLVRIRSSWGGRLIALASSASGTITALRHLGELRETAEGRCRGDERRWVDGRHPDPGLVDLEEVGDQGVEVDVGVGKVVESKFFPVPRTSVGTVN